jgi:prophage regulatory protein
MALAIVEDKPTSVAQRLILRREVERLTGLPRSTLYEKIKKGEFPRPVRLTPRLSAFIQAEVDVWITQRIAERDATKK